jgi:hypothetical protein
MRDDTVDPEPPVSNEAAARDEGDALGAYDVAIAPWVPPPGRRPRVQVPAYADPHRFAATARTPRREPHLPRPAHGARAWSARVRQQQWYVVSSRLATPLAAFWRWADRHAISGPGLPVDLAPEGERRPLGAPEHHALPREAPR